MASQSRKPIFLVSGATGAQGGSVVNYLLKSGKWHIRGITRKLNSEKVKKLQQQGVEMIACDYTKPDELKQAMKGAEVYFAVTNSWDPAQMPREFEIGKIQVDCAKEAGIKHFIFSSLPNVDEISKGKLHVSHFTMKVNRFNPIFVRSNMEFLKAKIAEYALKNVPTTLVEAAYYFQNFGTFFPPTKADDGTDVYTFPKISSMDGFDVSDYGEAVVTCANNRKEYLNKRVCLSGDRLSIEEYVKQIGEVTGVKTRTNIVPNEDYAKIAGNELAQMFAWFEQYGYYGPNSEEAVKLGKKAAPNLKTFKQFLQANRK